MNVNTFDSAGNQHTIIEKTISEPAENYGTINSGRPEEVLEKYGVPEKFIGRDMSVQL